MVVVNSLAHSIARCSNYSGVGSQIIAPLVEVLGASAGVFFQFTIEGEVPVSADHVALWGVLREAADQYINEQCRFDPLFKIPADRPTRLSAILAAQEGRPIAEEARRYCEGFLRSYGIGDIIGLQFPVASLTGPKLLQVGFHRRADMPDFCVSDLGVIEEVAPTLKLAFANLALAEDARMMRGILAALEDQLGGLVAILDQRTGKLFSPSASRAEPARPIVKGPASRETLPQHLLVRFERRVGPSFPDRSDVELTPRELEIVDALREGHSNTSMAFKLGISVRTVENHLRSIYAKMTVNSRTQLLAKLL